MKSGFILNYPILLCMGSITCSRFSDFYLYSVTFLIASAQNKKQYNVLKSINSKAMLIDPKPQGNEKLAKIAAKSAQGKFYLFEKYVCIRK